MCGSLRPASLRSNPQAKAEAPATSRATGVSATTQITCHPMATRAGRGDAKLLTLSPFAGLCGYLHLRDRSHLCMLLQLFAPLIPMTRPFESSRTVKRTRARIAG